jgi:hypothetical protein
MKKTLSEANKLESKILTEMVHTMDLLNSIHCWGDDNLDRDKLWEIRARLQDAIRAMHDEKALRKNLEYNRR